MLTFLSFEKVESITLSFKFLKIDAIMSEIKDDPREVLVLLNSLGFVGITAIQLKAFMKGKCILFAATHFSFSFSLSFFYQFILSHYSLLLLIIVAT